MKILTQLLLIVLLASLMISAASADRNREIFVAVNGRDSNPGTRSRPVGTLQQARNIARQIKAQTKGQVTIIVQGGAYYLKRVQIKAL